MLELEWVEREFEIEWEQRVMSLEQANVLRAFAEKFQCEVHIKKKDGTRGFTDVHLVMLTMLQGLGKGSIMVVKIQSPDAKNIMETFQEEVMLALGERVLSPTIQHNMMLV